MEAIKQCYAITQELIGYLKGDGEKESDMIGGLLDQRKAALTLLKKPTTENEKKLGAALLQQDKELLELLHAEKRSIQQDIKELKLKKNSNQKYVNPYQSLQTDGIYYDKRK
ncbi:flagellar protein FliT [Niallia taxi]|uniref:Flagellar protein FliT n=1 Tax=Niallia taxi TaxID=2499688 RepID=A0A437KCM9_9BACI|nr:flagellar protein FliT [Niallia taxi]MCM3216277.1 flagellar protein FliT [Niallia taxi]MDK8640332.1 flagellar protein FliT [Niallia taxi]MED4039238.1 flagellar protein FliT [Niallia taxi]MED4054974.1 flagellar protein FliT [Niallia taxi]MED4121014.1 flagellar protein FliT [Niallia taxi]